MFVQYLIAFIIVAAFIWALWKFVGRPIPKGSGPLPGDAANDSHLRSKGPGDNGRAITGPQKDH